MHKRMLCVSILSDSIGWYFTGVFSWPLPASNFFPVLSAMELACFMKLAASFWGGTGDFFSLDLHPVDA
jgi:hypothetical protein